MTSADVTRSLVRMFSPHKNLVVPNCCTKLAWEADLLVVRPSGWAEEFEIKVSIADFRREFVTKEDKHRALPIGFPTSCRRYGAAWKEGETFDPENPLHIATGVESRTGQVYAYEDHSKMRPHLIKRFWYAMPSEIAEKVRAEIPEYAGLIVVAKGRWGHEATVEKEAPKLKNCRKVTDDERSNLYRACYYRFWDMKQAQERQATVAGALS